MSITFILSFALCKKAGSRSVSLSREQQMLSGVSMALWCITRKVPDWHIGLAMVLLSHWNCVICDFLSSTVSTRIIPGTALSSFILHSQPVVAFELKRFFHCSILRTQQPSEVLCDSLCAATGLSLAKSLTNLVMRNPTFFDTSPSSRQAFPTLL